MGFSLLKKSLKQLGIIGLTLLGLLIFTFALQQASPIDPVLKRVGDKASEATYLQVKAELGLDKPIVIQFFQYVKKAVTGDFGLSSVSQEPIILELLRVFPATLELAILSIILGSISGIILGLLSAYFANRSIDKLIRIIILPGIAMPAFLLGLMLITLFYGHLEWLPIGGKWSSSIEYQFPYDFVWSQISLIDALRSPVEGALKDALLHLVLPVSLLSYYTLCSICRITRGAALAELSKEYVSLAKVTGNHDVSIIVRHILPNIKSTLIILIALNFTHLLEGAVLTEVVFAWPGIGRYLKEAFLSGDQNAILGGTLLIGTCFILINMLSERLAKQTLSNQ
ncbi:ABC transporter permease [Thorsellia anophelis]|uniref:Peptide/nickel transport system permease protein n=1 Tax=Thorsellia anophelis DSM 18579 TaxID=1123402 RepID=A0A1I0ATI3_9GAMM|nr:ABC transporter permease [Thorsellia anophelis]SES97701.1 peptide/nickel transport system permease protein [Thorsellia anophelis DSM 18579]